MKYPHTIKDIVLAVVGIAIAIGIGGGYSVLFCWLLFSGKCRLAICSLIIPTIILMIIGKLLDSLDNK